LLIFDEQKALKLIYDKYFSLVYSFISKECRSAEDSKDLTQDVFLKLWKTRSRLYEIESLKNYLFISARNTFIDYVRRKVNQEIFEELTAYNASDSQEFELNDQELIDVLLKYSEDMPEKRLQVFKLRWIDDKSRKEIAEQLGISIVTVDIHIRKALGFLKEKVKANSLLAILLLFSY